MPFVIGQFLQYKETLSKECAYASNLLRKCSQINWKGREGSWGGKVSSKGAFSSKGGDSLIQQGSSGM